MKKVRLFLICGIMIACLSSCIFDISDILIDSDKNEYNVGGRGPANGYVFYDKGYYSDGWRYLEAIRYSDKVTFGYYRSQAYSNNMYVNGSQTYNFKSCTDTSIGQGENNTRLLVTAMGKYGDYAYRYESGYGTTSSYAANICSNYKYNGYDDWFLPSREELNAIYKELFKKGIGDFPYGFYWTSSEYQYSPEDVLLQLFDESYESGDFFYGPREQNAYMCLVRSF